MPKGFAKQAPAVRDGEQVEVPLTVAQHQMLVEAAKACDAAAMHRQTVVNTLSAGHSEGPMNYKTENRDGKFFLILTKPEVPKT